MFPFYIARSAFGRMPVRDNRATADADAKALGKGSTVQGLTTMQAAPLLAHDRERSGVIAALRSFNGQRLDARLARTDH